MRPIRFLFDYISPYAYIAWHGALALAERHARPIEPEPILFAAVLDAHGQLGPAEIPAKRRYVFRDALRKAHGADLPLSPPPAHPFNPLTALRITHALDGAERQRAVTVLFAATWGGGPGVDRPDALIDVLDTAGFDGAALVERARDSQLKAALRTSTSAAIGRGVFGVPTLLVDDELFWGCDSLPHLDAFLAGDDPVPADLDARWRDLPVGAVRPGIARR